MIQYKSVTCLLEESLEFDGYTFTKLVFIRQIRRRIEIIF
jgi:hypothetical protein